jgi:hypothetical protein
LKSMELPMNVADIEAAAESIRRHIASIDSNETEAPEWYRHRLIGTLNALDFLLGKRPSLLGDPDLG